MNKFYVIILDSDKNNPRHWVYVAKRASLKEIKEVEQYSVNERQLVSKVEYEGKFTTDTTVRCTETGDSANGEIYQLMKKRGKHK